MKKVLIVDDNLGTALTTKISFERNGIIADYCLDAKQALSKVKETNYDYILIDIIINGDKENGIFLCKRLAKDGVKSKIIFITGCNQDSLYAEEANALAPIVYKEFSPKQLAKEILDGKYD